MQQSLHSICCHGPQWQKLVIASVNPVQSACDVDFCFMPLVPVMELALPVSVATLCLLFDLSSDASLHAATPAHTNWMACDFQFSKRKKKDRTCWQLQLMQSSRIVICKPYTRCVVMQTPPPPSASAPAPPSPPAPPAPPCTNPIPSLCPVVNATYYSYYHKTRYQDACTFIAGNPGLSFVPALLGQSANVKPVFAPGKPCLLCNIKASCRLIVFSCVSWHSAVR